MKTNATVNSETRS